MRVLVNTGLNDAAASSGDCSPSSSDQPTKILRQVLPEPAPNRFTTLLEALVRLVVVRGIFAGKASLRLRVQQWRSAGCYWPVGLSKRRVSRTVAFSTFTAGR